MNLFRSLTEKRWYRWLVIGLCFLMIFITLGFCSTNKGLYLAAITDALKIKRSLFSLGDSLRYITSCIVNIFFGALVAKFGTKKLIFVGFSLLILTMVSYITTDSVIGFWIGGVLLGAGLSFTTTAMVGCIVNRWCRSSKGTIMGAVLAANGVGGALAAQIVVPIIYREGDPFGYRKAYTLVIVLLAATVTLIMLFYRENPPESLLNEPLSDPQKRGSDREGISFETAIRRPYFYGAGICVFLSGMVLQAVTVAAAAHMRDSGIDADYISLVISIHSLALSAFKFGAGLLYDRVGLRKTLNICYVASVFMMLLLASVNGSTAGRISAMAYGIISSVALPLETIMLPLLTSGLYGQKSFNRLLGVTVSINTAGYAVGAPLLNFTFDLFGSYTPMLYIFGGIMVVVMIAIQFVLRAAKADEEVKPQEQEKA